MRMTRYGYAVDANPILYHRRGRGMGDSGETLMCGAGNVPDPTGSYCQPAGLAKAARPRRSRRCRIS